MEKRFDIYQHVTDKIIKLLEDNVVPWKKPWHDGGIPSNLITKRAYRGINLLLLALTGYKQNLFLSFKQVKDLGGSVKKDEKAHLVVFWKALPKKDEAEDEQKSTSVKRVLRYYYVFNIEQCTGLPANLIPDITQPNDPISTCEGIVGGMPEKPEIRYMENIAYYHPEEDYINMPDIEYFIDSKAYYSTLFHELIHSTGHPKRLNRKEIAEPSAFGTDPYSIEELVAELGSCFLQSYTGIVYNLTNSSAYIKGWLVKLKGDKRFVFQASSSAQKACDYILKIDRTDEMDSIAHPQSHSQ